MELRRDNERHDTTYFAFRAAVERDVRVGQRNNADDAQRNAGRRADRHVVIEAFREFGTTQVCEREAFHVPCSTRQVSVAWGAERDAVL